MDKNRNIWKDGVMGVVVGDALGCPVQFESRKEVARNPITGMRGYGTFDLPEGSWTDDSSMTLATLESLNRKKEIDLDDIMTNFIKWLEDGAFTPYEKSFDVGIITRKSIYTYQKNHKARKCGSDGERDNGNGSLMRILPVCLYCYEKQRDSDMTDEEAIRHIHDVGSLTHAHIRSNIACGLYYFMIKEILGGTGSLKDRLAEGITKGYAFYESFLADKENLYHYDRLRDLDVFAKTERAGIKSSGYVVDTLEASVWSLLQEDTFEKSLLTAVNLGEDTDTVGAIAGGLAGLWYGYGEIPEKWLRAIIKRDWIEKMFSKEI